MADFSRLRAACVSLRAESPEGWERLMHELHAYAAASTADMLRCPPELLMRGQGIALGVSELYQILKTAHQAPPGKPVRGQTSDRQHA